MCVHACGHRSCNWPLTSPYPAGAYWEGEWGHSSFDSVSQAKLSTSLWFWFPLLLTGIWIQICRYSSVISLQLWLFQMVSTLSLPLLNSQPFIYFIHKQNRVCATEKQMLPHLLALCASLAHRLPSLDCSGYRSCSCPLSVSAVEGRRLGLMRPAGWIEGWSRSRWI